MPVQKAYNEVLGPIGDEDQKAPPQWLPGDEWPSPDTLDYLTKLASLVFVAVGLLYFVGIRPARGFTKAHVADV